MSEQTARDNQTLIGFWDKAFAQADDAAEGEADWKALAPSEKLCAAACELGGRKRVLDLGCGSGWASVIAARSGCPDVTAVDPAPAAVRAAEAGAVRWGAAGRIRAVCGGPDWLRSVPDASYDGLICSNVLDVIPPETAADLLRESARILTPDAAVVIGLNYFLSPEDAAARGMPLADRRLYMDGVLRLVSRTDGEWAEIFAPWYIVECLEHFAWPGEDTERRRLFRLRRRA